MIVNVFKNIKNLKTHTNPIKLYLEVINMINIKTLGNNIRAERKKQLLTMEALSEMAEITENFLGKIERGEGKASLDTINNIAKALNVSIDFLIREDSEISSEYSYITSLMEVNKLSDSEKEKFIGFVMENIKYFK